MSPNGGEDIGTQRVHANVPDNPYGTQRVHKKVIIEKARNKK